MQNRLRLLRVGRLRAGPDTTFETIEYLDRRIVDVTVRRDRLQTALDSCLQQAAALVAEPVTS